MLILLDLSFGDSKYRLTFINDKSKYTIVYISKLKFKVFQKKITRLNGKRIDYEEVKVREWWGVEFKNFQGFCIENGILKQLIMFTYHNITV